ncbi:activator-dependent family glycosyltransferase [Streptomyces apricus]|uniref:Activator-dependent family glycosyltransferase n=1 Tax=Streptomyces apricus TaxID=1828112 RepID=A0A5B0BAJ8_9ACTN|nr:activator-dependent family glycosyltransferase [Streptomyces apricus]KAA0939273.1 activator-dependent family glycosyltransferase [Streptomyces apricus]
MRVLFTVLALDSHFYNSVPIAWALRAAGHEVRVASQPDLTETITRAGLTAVPVGEELALLQRSQQSAQSSEPGYGTGYDLTETDPQKLTWEYVRDTFGAYTYVAEGVGSQTVLEDLARFAREWQPDLVVWDAMTYVGPVVARACGAAHARLLFGTDHWARMREVFLARGAEQTPEDRVDPMAGWMTARLSSLGLDPEAAGAFGEDLVVGQRTIDPLPSWVRVPAGLDRLPVRPVMYNGPAVVPDWVHERPKLPRVVLTLGLSLPGAYTDGFPISDLLAAAADLEVELIATAGAEAAAALSASGLPDNVRIVDFVPLNEVLPTCSAIIHHGGMGTLQNALRHGVPQIVVPGWLRDEKGNAAALEQQGAALVIDPSEFTAGTLREKLARLLAEPGFRQNADRLRTELLALPTPHDIVPELERLAAERGDRRPAAE